MGQLNVGKLLTAITESMMIEQGIANQLLRAEQLKQNLSHQNIHMVEVMQQNSQRGQDPPSTLYVQRDSAMFTSTQPSVAINIQSEDK